MKNKDITGTKVCTLYEGLTYKELKEVIDEFVNFKSVNSDIETKKIKKGTYDKSFFRGKTKK